jgi:hypothetical protein
MVADEPPRRLVRTIPERVLEAGGLQMRVMVMSRPKHRLQPQEMPMLFQGFSAWREKYRHKMEAFEFFLGGGGFGIVDVDDEAALNQLIVEMPFTPYTEITVEPFVEGDTGFRQFREAMAAMVGAAS